MKSKSLVLMVISLGFGLVAAIGISQVMGRNNGSQVQEIPKRAVLVAAVDLEHHSFLTEENVKIEEWPLDIIPENTAGSLEQIAEMATRQSLAKGMPINLGSLVHKLKMNDINIPKGFTVIPIKVPAEDNNHGILRPGDKVNVIGHIRGKPAKTFLRGLRVWSVNAQMTSKSVSREEGSTSSDAIIGILANERQSELIMQVQKEGAIKLVMRGDHVEVDAEGALDEEGIAGLGLMEDEEVATPNVISSPFPSPVRQTTPSKTMRIWSKEGFEVVTFRDGVAVTPGPADRHGAPVIPSESGAGLEKPSSPGDLDDSEDGSGYSESDRGLEEDQY